MVLKRMDVDQRRSRGVRAALLRLPSTSISSVEGDCKNMVPEADAIPVDVKTDRSSPLKAVLEAVSAVYTDHETRL